MGKCKVKDCYHFYLKALHCHHQRRYHSSNSNIHLRPSNRLYNNLYNLYNFYTNFRFKNRLLKNLYNPFSKEPHNGCLAHLHNNKSLCSQLLNL